MKPRKIILGLLILIGITILVVVILFLLKFNKTSDLTSHIPENADYVFYLNSKKVLSQFSEIKKNKDIGELENLFTEYLKAIPDLKNTGLDLLANAALVGYKKNSFIILLINNEQKWLSTVKAIPNKLIEPIIEFEKYKQVHGQRDGFTLYWNNNTLLLFPKQNSDSLRTESFINELFEINKSNCFANKKEYENLKREKDLIWFYVQNTDLKITKDTPLKGYFNLLFNNQTSTNTSKNEPEKLVNSKINFEIFATNNLFSNYSDSFNFPGATAFTNTIYSDSGNSIISKYFYELTAYFLPNQFDSIRKISLDHFKKSLIVGAKIIKPMITVQYEYDDNFNQKRVEKIEYDTIQEACLNLVDSNSENPKYFYNSYPINLDFNKIPKEVKILVDINQEFTSSIFLNQINYSLKFMRRQESNYHNYHLRFEIEKSGILKFINQVKF